MSRPVRWLIVLSFLSLFLVKCPPLWAQSNVWTYAGLAGLDVSVLGVDPNDPNTIYAGINGDGVVFGGVFLPGTGLHVFKTSDGGATWNEVSNGLPPPPAPGDATWRLASVSALVVDPNNSSTVYAGIYSVYWAFPGWVHDAPSLFKSTDSGMNWVRADFGLPTDSSSLALAADPTNPNTLYAASGDSSQVYKTTDGGTNWNATVSGQPQGSNYFNYNYHATLAVDPRNSDTVYLGFYGAGVFKSTDAGKTWSAPITGPLVVSDTDRGMEYALMGVHALAIDPQSPGTIYVGTVNMCACMDEPLPTGVWKSADGGTTWSAVNTGLPPVVNHPVEMQPIWSLAVHPNSAGTLYAAIGLTVFKTTNGGENWHLLTDSLNSTGRGGFIEDLLVTSARPGVLYAGASRAGVSRITDQIPVLSLQSEYCARSPWTLAVSNGPPNTPIRLTGTGNGQPWEIPQWGTTDANGNFSQDGTFNKQVLGSWTEIVEVGGAHSNGISFVVSDCGKNYSRTVKGMSFHR
jgi:photosystem II stability/assembly factor-like uncharacterized protein